jgi:hypothetical protein
MMSDKDIKSLIELAGSKIRAEVTTEEALRSLMSAGILNENGEYTPPFRQLLDEAME